MGLGWVVAGDRDGGNWGNECDEGMFSMKRREELSGDGWPSLSSLTKTATSFLCFPFVNFYLSHRKTKIPSMDTELHQAYMTDPSPDGDIDFRMREIVSVDVYSSTVFILTEGETNLNSSKAIFTSTYAE